MRMYGRTGPNGAGSAGPPPPPPLRNNNEGILPEKPTGTPSSYASATLRKNEETKEKLENPYYYYGSTRNQKKTAGKDIYPLLSLYYLTELS